MGAYTETQILQMCETAFQDIPAFYRADAVKYRSNIKGTHTPCTEVIAAFLCSRITAYMGGFSRITRRSSYRVTSHNGNYNPASNRIEEIIAMQLFRQCKGGSALKHIGAVIDYQTPLKDTNQRSAGKIDLLSVDHQTKTVWILELKKPGANQPEPMLRCVLEGFTYLQIVDQSKLKQDFGIPADYTVKASPLVFYGDYQWHEMQKKRPALRKLMQLLDSTPFYLSQKDGRYLVTV